MTTTRPKRQRLAAAVLGLGVALMASGLFLTPATAADAPAYFGAGYDSYLNDNQRGIDSTGVDNNAKCPTDDSVDGLTAWHFVLSANTHDFASLDVRFTIGGSTVDLTALTPKTTAQWATFDPAKNFIADPDGKHAYVYTNGTGTLVDAAAQDAPDTAGPKFQLSHVCAGEGVTTTTAEETTSSSVEETTTTEEATTTTEEATTTTEEATTTTEEATTTTEEATTTTEEATTTTEEATTTTDPSTTSSVLSSTTEQGSPSTQTRATVAGVQVTRALPRTGSSSTLPLTGAGTVLILAGLVALRLGRERAYR